MTAPCISCGTWVLLTPTSPMIITEMPGMAVHHCPPSMSATTTLEGTCGCGARIRVNYVLGKVLGPPPVHAQDGNRKCPHCGNPAQRAPGPDVERPVRKEVWG